IPSELTEPGSVMLAADIYSSTGLLALFLYKSKQISTPARGSYRTSSSEGDKRATSKLGRRGDGGQVPAPGGEGGRRDGVHAGDRPRHRRASRPGGRRRRHLLPEAGPAEQSIGPPSRFVCPALLVCVLPVFPSTVLRIGDLCGLILTDGG